MGAIGLLFALPQLPVKLAGFPQTVKDSLDLIEAPFSSSATTVTADHIGPSTSPAAASRKRSPLSGRCTSIGIRSGRRNASYGASEDGYTEQKMFGGIGFMLDGHTVGSAARVA
jgi:hypothetical protein